MDNKLDNQADSWRRLEGAILLIKLMMSLEKRSVGTWCLAVTGRGYSVTALGPLTAKQPASHVQARVPETQGHLCNWQGDPKMEKDRPPQLMTPASVKAIISRIEAAQLTRAQEVTPEMKKSPFYWDLKWRLGTNPRLGQDSNSGPSGVLRILSKLGLQTD